MEKPRENGQANRAFTKITASTWGDNCKSKIHYSTVIRPAMTHGSIRWHSPSDARKVVVQQPEIIQNNYLPVIAGACKATPIEVLQAETMVPPMKEHTLEELQAKTRPPQNPRPSSFHTKHCKRVATKSRKRRLTEDRIHQESEKSRGQILGCPPVFLPGPSNWNPRIVV